MGSKKRKVQPVPPHLDAYVMALAKLPLPVLEDVLLYLDQRDLSPADVAMMPMPVTEELKIVRDCIATISKKKSGNLIKIGGAMGISYKAFDTKNPGFICLTKFPMCQTMVGPRGIDNRPAWLTDIRKEDFWFVEQSRVPMIAWEDKEWGIPIRLRIIGTAMPDFVWGRRPVCVSTQTIANSGWGVYNNR